MSGSKMLLAVMLLCCSASPIVSYTEDIVQWSFISYDFSSEDAQEHSKLFKPENTVLTGLEVGDDRLFLAAPRLRTGIPATLSTVSKQSPLGSSPVLEAFPNWEWHDAGKGVTNCSGLISVYRLRCDSCGRLWALDSGVMDSLDDFRRVCSPKIVIFDMKTSNPLRAITFPEDLLRPNSLFTNLVIDETTSSPHKGCDDVFVYITDTAAPGMIVYDSAADSAWRVTHASMYPDPDFSDYQIGEDKFMLMDGVVGLAHSPILKTLYFHPLATDRTFSISTDVLRQGPPAEGQELPVTLVGRKSSQGLGIAVNALTDTLYYSPLTETALASWNPHTNKHKVLDYDPEKLQFAAEVRWIAKDPDCVWLLTTRFQKYFLQNVSPADINIRVLRVSAEPTVSPRFYRHTNATGY